MNKKEKKKDYAVFTKDMKKTHTIIAPSMFPIHFKILSKVLKDFGYNIEFFKGSIEDAREEGLKSVHNDICYPAMIVIGQLVSALKSGIYDKDKTALIITQTGGGCRASNYIHLLRKALKNNGLEHVPVISLSVTGLKEHPGFKLSISLLVKVMISMYYGDFLMWIYNQCKTYEINQGECDIVLEKSLNLIDKNNKMFSFLKMKKVYRDILQYFAQIKLRDRTKIKVGIVGEIYMKYSPLGNNNLEELLRSEGVEVVISGVMDFFMYCLSNPQRDYELYGINKWTSKISNIVLFFLEYLQQVMIKTIKKYSTFKAPTAFKNVKKLANGYIDLGVKMGEGWLMTAEMLELINSGVENVVCTQPFGCLPNHIVGKGMVRKILNHYPKANIVVVDYDPSATKVNQENRIKLMLSNAKLSSYL